MGGALHMAFACEFVGQHKKSDSWLACAVVLSLHFISTFIVFSMSWNKYMYTCGSTDLESLKFEIDLVTFWSTVCVKMFLTKQGD